MEVFEVDRALCVMNVSQNGHWKPLLAFKIRVLYFAEKRQFFGHFAWTKCVEMSCFELCMYIAFCSSCDVLL